MDKRTEKAAYPLVSFRSIGSDDRGALWDMLPANTVIRSVLQAYSEKGSIRASHTHKKDNHYVFLIKGEMLYEWSEDGQLKSKLIIENQMIYTPAGTYHRMTFLRDTVFLAFATEARTHESYENDTQRETIDGQV